MKKDYKNSIDLLPYKETKIVENFGPKRILTNTEADVSYEDYID